MTTVATVSGLTIADANRCILKNIDLTLEAGTVTGLVGTSGAGKTTLALALLGHLPPELRHRSGTIRVLGTDPLTRHGARVLRGRAAAYLPQDPASALDPARTVRAQLHTACRITHSTANRRERERIVTSSIESAALEREVLTLRPLQLSGGQAQRALLAWTLIIRPQLLILDEPTSSLDPETAERVSHTFANLPWNPAVLLVSHDRELVARVSDRVTEIDAGRLAHAGDRESVSRSCTPPVSPMRDSAPNAWVRASGFTAERVTIQRGGRTVVSDASLTVAPGEMVAIRGRTGSGKTSLARALCGFSPPTTGTLLLHGNQVPWEAVERLRRAGPFIASVGQDARAALHPGETVELTLIRAIRTAHRRRPSHPSSPEALLDLVGLQRTMLGRLPAELSGGQRHRLVLARALAANPDVLVCDEMTAALDRAVADRILDALDDIRTQIHLPILLITHQVSVAARADRVLVLTEGSLV